MTKKNVGIFVNEMFHYREGIYRLLLNSEIHNINIFTGNKKNTNLPITEIPEIKCDIFGKTFWYQKGVRKIIKSYNLDIVIIQYTPYMVSSRFLTLFNKSRDYKIVAWTHGYYRGNREGFKAKTLEKALKRADGILFFSEDMVEIYKEKGFSKDNMFYTDNTLDTDTIFRIQQELSDTRVDNFRRKYNIRNKKVILFVGRIIKSKRLKVLLKAMEFLKEKNIEPPFLFIIGDGEQKSFLQHRFMDTLSKYISWEGKITNEKELAPFFTVADLFVMPGKTGLSINHAFSYGLPYITTNDDIHAPEIILLEAGKNGQYFNGNDSLDLAKKINEILYSHEKLKKYSKNAVNTIKKRYNVKNMYDNFIRMIEIIDD